MDYKIIDQSEINKRVNEVFAKILDDLPKPKDKNGNASINGEQYLAVTDGSQIVDYAEFYKQLHSAVFMYIPQKGENPIIRFLLVVPRIYKNIKKIKAANEIIEYQKEILAKYFESSSKYNIKNKILELKDELNDPDIRCDEDLVNKVICDFDSRMRGKVAGYPSIMKDLDKLSKLIEEREKI